MTAAQEAALLMLDRAALFLDLAIENAMPEDRTQSRDGAGGALVLMLTEDQADAVDHARSAVFEAIRDVGKEFTGSYSIGARTTA